MSRAMDRDLEMGRSTASTSCCPEVVLRGQHTIQRSKMKRKLGKRLGGLYTKLVYDSRPNTTSTETREEQWNKIVDPDRYLYGLLVYLGPPSFFSYNLRKPLLLVGGITILSCTYHTCYILYPNVLPTIFNRTAWDLFRMGSFALSLLLSVKVSKVYDRFWEARSHFSKIGGNLNMAMQLLELYSRTHSGSMEGMNASDVDRILGEFAAWAMVYPYALVVQLLALKGVPEEVHLLLNQEEVKLLNSTPKPRKYVLMKLQDLLHQFPLPTEKYLCMQKLLQDTEAACGVCRRIRFTALPYGLSQLYTGFIMIWLCILPLGIQYSGSGQEGTLSDIMTVWLSGIVVNLFSLMMISVDEVANQLEDPFPSIPLMDTIKTSMKHIATVQKDFALLRATCRAETETTSTTGSKV